MDGHRSRYDQAGKTEREDNRRGTFVHRFLGEGFYPINVLNAIKNVPEVARVFCSTANPTEVLVAQTEQGRGIPGVVDGFSPQGVEEEEDIAWRKDFLRMIGNKVR